MAASGYDKIDFHIRGLVPCLMHNGQLADPLNPFVKQMKEITSKRKKTDEDLQRLGDIEWEGGLYTDADKDPCWPGENLEAMIKSAAQTERRGKDTDVGIAVPDNAKLIIPGKKLTIAQMKEMPEFRLRKTASNQASTIIRTRPRFPVGWELKFALHYLPELVNKSDAINWVRIAAWRIGLSDWRPRYGRFEVLSPKV